MAETLQDKTPRRNEKPFGSGIHFSRGMCADSVRTWATNEPEVFSKELADRCESGDFTFDDLQRSGGLRAWYDALEDVPQFRMYTQGPTGGKRAIMASAFPLLMGNLTISQFNAQYVSATRVSDRLVTEMDTNKRSTEIAAILNTDVDVDTVPEGEMFPPISAGEERYTILQKRNGRRLSLTEDAIQENNVADFVNQVNALAEIYSYRVEYQSLERIQDIDGSASSAARPYVLNFNGSGTPLYVTSNAVMSRLGSSGNRIVDNALGDDSDLEEARVLLAAMTNSLGFRVDIPLSGCQLLVPSTLEPTALKIRNSILTPGESNAYNAWGPQGQYTPEVIASAVLDRYSTTAWYLGDFRKQFKRVWKTRMAYMSLGGQTESMLQSAIAFQASIRWSMEVGATDAAYVIQNLVSTGYPERP